MDHSLSTTDHDNPDTIVKPVAIMTISPRWADEPSTTVADTADMSAQLSPAKELNGVETQDSSLDFGERKIGGMVKAERKTALERALNTFSIIEQNEYKGAATGLAVRDESMPCSCKYAPGNANVHG
jgi:hypothetical protein